MTAWGGYTAADFDARRAPRYIRQNREAGQDDLFGAGTPTVPAKPAELPEQMPGQGDLFGTDDGPCTCGDCRPDPYPPETMRPGRGHWECCGQHCKAPWHQDTTTTE